MNLFEGGNEFKLDDGSNATKQDASSEEAKATAGALGKEIGIDLESRLGGSIIYPGAETGDADTILDPSDFIKTDPQAAPKDTQNKFREWLAQKLQGAGYKELPKKATVPAPGKYYKIAGDGLTVSVQIPGSSEWLQVDLDIAEPGEGEFSLWSKRGEPNEPGTPKDARAKGAYRHILLAAIGSILVSTKHPQGLSWSYKNGLIDRATKETITKNPNEVAEILFGGTAADLDNINTILAKFKQAHPGQYNEVIQKVNTGLESYKTKYRMKESHPVGSPTWFRDMINLASVK